MKNSTKLLVRLFGISLLFFRGIQAFGQDWSAEQKKVWKMEIGYWDLHKTGDVKGLMEFYHEDYIGWPHWSPKPIGKQEFEKGLVFRERILSYELNPMAIKLFNNYAFIFYRFSCVGGDRINYIGRSKRLWIKQGGKWKIFYSYTGGSTMDDK